MVGEGGVVRVHHPDLSFCFAPPRNAQKSSVAPGMKPRGRPKKPVSVPCPFPLPSQPWGFLSLCVVPPHHGGSDPIAMGMQRWQNVFMNGAGGSVGSAESWLTLSAESAPCAPLRPPRGAQLWALGRAHRAVLCCTLRGRSRSRAAWRG